MNAHLERIQKATDLIEEAITVMGDERGYWLGKMNDQLALLFERFAPCKAGDHVRLLQTPDFDKEYGWLEGVRSWLKMGVEGVVHEVDADRRGFLVNVVFAEHPTHYYCFAETKLEVVSPPASEAETDGG